MYTSTFGLRANPFEDRADTAFFFPAPAQEEILAAMQHEVQYGTGISLLIGETGMGKTMLVRVLTGRLTNGEKVVVLRVPANGANDTIREACKGFGVSLPSTLHDARGLARLQRRLARCVRDGRQPVLIIDQAENLTPGDLNDLETLIDGQNEGGRLLRVILAAHPRFRSLLVQPAFERIRQIASARYEIPPLQYEDTQKYIQHRLRAAGSGDREIFSSDAISAIFTVSNGNPRTINRACSTAIIAACAEGRTRVERNDVEDPQRMADLGDAQKNDSIGPSYSRLSALVEQASSVVDTLSRRIPQPSSSVQQIEGDFEELAQRLSTQLLELAESSLAGFRTSLTSLVESATTKLCSNLDRAQEAAEQTGHSLSSLIASAENRLAQLASYQSAATHLHERLVRSIQSGHPLAEQADCVLNQLDQRIALSQKEGALLDSRINAATTEMERIQASTATSAAMLNDIVASAGEAIEQLPALIEQATQQQAGLEIAVENVAQQAGDAQHQLSTHLQAYEQRVQEGETGLQDFHRRFDAMEAQLERITAMADAARQTAAVIQEAVGNAQTQSEHLERVTVAVRKVFAGLSQASLGARNQGQELDQLITQANQTASTIRQWLDGMRRQLNGVIGMDLLSCAAQGKLATSTGTIGRAAELRIEDEPGAAGAHMVEGGLAGTRTPAMSSAAREIAQLIESAKRAIAGESEGGEVASR